MFKKTMNLNIMNRKFKQW